MSIVSWWLYSTICYLYLIWLHKESSVIDESRQIFTMSEIRQTLTSDCFFCFLSLCAISFIFIGSKLGLCFCLEYGKQLSELNVLYLIPFIGHIFKSKTEIILSLWCKGTFVLLQKIWLCVCDILMVWYVDSISLVGLLLEWCTILLPFLN